MCTVATCATIWAALGIFMCYLFVHPEPEYQHAAIRIHERNQWNTSVKPLIMDSRIVSVCYTTRHGDNKISDLRDVEELAVIVDRFLCWLHFHSCPLRAED